MDRLWTPWRMAFIEQASGAAPRRGLPASCAPSRRRARAATALT